MAETAKQLLDRAAADPDSLTLEDLQKIKKIRKATQAAGAPGSDAARVEQRRAQRAEARDVHIPAIANPRRRRGCEGNLRRFFEVYAPGVFCKPWADYHREIIRDMESVILHGDRLAMAAPRGGGKSAIVLYAILWAVLYGHRSFCYYVCDTFKNSIARFKTIRTTLETSRLLLDDFPGPCACIRALRRIYNRAGGQTAQGHPTYISMGGGVDNLMMLPTLEGDPSSSGVIGYGTMSSAVRGIECMRPDGQMIRPDFLILDDPQSRADAVSPERVAALSATIRGEMLGLGGPGKTLPVVYIGTVIQAHDLTAEYVDRAQHPDWRGRVYRMMDTMPARMDLWQKYEEIRATAMRAGEAKEAATRKAAKFYRANRRAMDQGAAATWKQRYDKGAGEISAVQSAMNILQDLGEEAFASEYQNAPKDAAAENALLVLDSYTVERSDSGLARGVIPDNAVVLVSGWDVGKFGVHWIVLAVAPGRIISIVDYGCQPVDAPTGKIDTADEAKAAALDAALLGALRRLRDNFAEEPYARASGETMDARLTLIDSRYATPVVRRFCVEGGQNYQPAVGCGSARHQQHWHVPDKSWVSADRYVHVRVDPDGLRYFVYGDAYKGQVQEGFLLPRTSAGSIALFGAEHYKVHHTFARHITAETQRETVPGRVTWEAARGRADNHWLDSAVYALGALSVVEAEIDGLGLGVSGPPVAVPVVRARRSGPSWVGVEGRWTL